MNDAFTSVAVVINVAPAAEERVVDWLLERSPNGGFTTYAVHGHGSSPETLSVAEQVIGRQKRIEFRAELPAHALDDFLAELMAAFDGSDAYYFVFPVLRSGHLSSQR